MKLTLTIVAALSSLLFIVFYGKIIITAFKHHVITGLISFIPGLNVIILPSIWDKVGGKFITSVVSLGIAAFTWNVGGYDYLKQNNIIQNQRTTQNEEVIEQQEVSISEPISGDLKEIRLPRKPLHFLVFVDTSREKYSELSNSDLRITLVDDSIIEGRTAEENSKSIITIEKYTQPAEGASRTQKIKIADIKRLQTLNIKPLGIQ